MSFKKRLQGALAGKKVIPLEERCEADGCEGGLIRDVDIRGEHAWDVCDDCKGTGRKDSQPQSESELPF